MKLKHIAAIAAFGLTGLATAGTGNKITPSLTSVDVLHDGRIVTIQRKAGKNDKIPPYYQKAGRHCPPFCVQPMHVLPGVETIGELEVLGYLKRIANGDKSVMVVDSRTPDWVMRGTIPGSVNVPWNRINLDVDGTFAIDAEAKTLEHIMHDEFGATKTDDHWDFSQAKTLVLFCNGIWCPQSSTNIRTLARMGYPTSKLKWYRGGMQDWVTVGLTTVPPTHE